MQLLYFTSGQKDFIQKMNERWNEAEIEREKIVAFELVLDKATRGNSWQRFSK